VGGGGSGTRAFSSCAKEKPLVEENQNQTRIGGHSRIRQKSDGGQGGEQDMLPQRHFSSSIRPRTSQFGGS